MFTRFGTALRALSLCLVVSACDGSPSETKDPETVPEFGDPSSRRFTEVAGARDSLSTPRDLAFDSDRPGELWVVNRGPAWGQESTVTLYGAGTSSQRAVMRKDSHRQHFMGMVSSLAMGARGTFATCQEQSQNFMGPSLWPLDTLVYAKVNQQMGSHAHRPGEPHLGSHLDMLHESPFCMGIAHERDNVFWVFDGAHAAIVRYDFQRDHGPGYDDHSDGIVRRYVDAKVARVPNVPSHLAMDRGTGWLYVADTGNRRVLRLDTRSGSVAGALPKAEPSIAEHSRVEGAKVEVLVSSGLVQPSGIDLHAGRLFVSDHATGEIVAFDLQGKELGRVKTPARGIVGITVGPDGRIWYVDGTGNAVVRIDPTG